MDDVIVIDWIIDIVVCDCVVGIDFVDFGIIDYG